MTVLLTPYIGFRGNAREAMEFYESVFGGDLTVSTFGDFGAAEEPGETDQVMHSVLTSPTGLTIMASDTPKRMDYNPGDNISISLSGDDEDALVGYWNKLSVGANITAPLERAQWGDMFGMCIDKFGTRWLVNVAAPTP